MILKRNQGVEIEREKGFLGCHTNPRNPFINSTLNRVFPIRGYDKLGVTIPGHGLGHGLPGAILGNVRVALPEYRKIDLVP